MVNSWSNTRSITLTVPQCLVVVGGMFAVASLLLLVAAQWLQWVPLVRLGIFGSAVAASGLGLFGSLWAERCLGHKRASARSEGLLILHTLTVGLLMVVEGQTFVSGAGSETLFCAWTLLVLPWLFWVRRPIAMGVIFLLGLTGTGLLSEALGSISRQGFALLPAAGWCLVWHGMLCITLPDDTPLASSLRVFVRLVTVILTAGFGAFYLCIERTYDWHVWVLLAGFFPLAYGRALSAKIIALLGWLAILNQCCSVWIDTAEWLWPTLFVLNLIGLAAVYAMVHPSGHVTNGWLISTVKILLVVPLMISFVSLTNLIFNEQITGIVCYVLAIVIGLVSLKRRASLHPFIRLVGLLIGWVGVFFIHAGFLSCAYEIEFLAGLYPHLSEFITVLCLVPAFLYRSSFALLVALMVALGLKATDISTAMLGLFPLTVASVLALSHDDERIAKMGDWLLFPLLWTLFVIHAEFFGAINPTILTEPVQTGLMVGITFILFLLPDAEGRNIVRRGLMSVLFSGLVYFWPQAIAPVLGAVVILRGPQSLRPLLLFTVLAMAFILYVLRASGAIAQGNCLLHAAWETLGIGIVFLVSAAITATKSFKDVPRLETHTPLQRACPVGAFLWFLVVLTVFGISHWRDQTLLSSGDVIVAKLSPVDPRDVLMGDFMALAYEVDIEAMGKDPRETHTLGLVTRADGRYELTSSAIGQPVTLSSDSFDARIVKLPRRWFFASGEANRWEKATQAILRCRIEAGDSSHWSGSPRVITKCLLETLQ